MAKKEREPNDEEDLGTPVGNAISAAFLKLVETPTVTEVDGEFIYKKYLIMFEAFSHLKQILNQVVPTQSTMVSKVATIHVSFDQLYERIQNFPSSSEVRDCLNDLAKEITILNKFIKNYNKDDGSNIQHIMRFEKALNELGVALSKLNFG